MTDRFIVVKGSQSAHCCFEATVVDTTQPVMIHDEHFDGQFEPICECFEVADAERIARAMNELELPTMAATLSGDLLP